jgi:hypothetical protein
MPIRNFDVEAWVKSRHLKSDGTHKLVKRLVPYTRSLFEAVYCFDKFQTVEVGIEIDTFRNCTEYLLLHDSIQESGHNIELIERPVKILSDRNDHA